MVLPRFVLVLALLFGAAGLSACANDDGRHVRDLTQETGIPRSASGASASPTP